MKHIDICLMLMMFSNYMKMGIPYKETHGAQLGARKEVYLAVKAEKTKHVDV